ncbi:MAG: hypothetical protein KAS32_14445, partial [Candidatus Peribacteraceae bacterium]|nr:hypothetical protein [Candidatus Peribacteraceae bacterium]
FYWKTDGGEPYLVLHNSRYMYTEGVVIPAPMFTELEKDLPSRYFRRGRQYELKISKYCKSDCSGDYYLMSYLDVKYLLKYKDNIRSRLWINGVPVEINSDNLTEAAADMWIKLKKEGVI